MKQSATLALATLLLAGGSSVAFAQSRDWPYRNHDSSWNDDKGYGPSYRGTEDRYGSGRLSRNGDGWDGPFNSQFDYERQNWTTGREDRRVRSSSSDWDRDRRDSYDRFGPGGNSRFEQSGQGSWEQRRFDRFDNESSHDRPSDFGRATGARSRTLEERASIRRELREAGFEDVHILDTAYLVRARTSSGRSVFFIVDPPETSLSSTASRSMTGLQPNSRKSSNSESNSNDQNSRQPLAGVSLSDVRSKLEQRGFSNIQNLRRDGSTFVAMANWYGDQMNVRVDGRNGYIIEPSHIIADQVESMLESNGWTDIGEVRDEGSSYSVKASKNGTKYRLSIDSRTGEINKKVGFNSSALQTSGSTSDKNQ